MDDTTRQGRVVFLFQFHKAYQSPYELISG